MRARTALVLSATALAAARATGFPARLGLTRTEAAVSLPGDLLLPTASVVADRAVLVDAPPGRIWPWLTQIGQDRGGFHSFTALENAIGCEVDDVSVLRPEWAVRDVGDEVRLAPGMVLRVAVSEPGDALVLTSAGGELPEEARDRAAADFDFTWAFVLLPHSFGRTRLHVRERYLPHTRRAAAAARAGLVASAVMSWRMLGRIRDLAEQG